jgi:hypothetical protein
MDAFGGMLERYHSFIMISLINYDIVSTAVGVEAKEGYNHLNFRVDYEY